MRLDPPLDLAVISIHAEVAEAVLQWNNWSFYRVSSKMFKLLQLRLWQMLKRTFHLLNMPIFLSVLSATLFIQTHDRKVTSTSWSHECRGTMFWGKNYSFSSSLRKTNQTEMKTNRHLFVLQFDSIHQSANVNWWCLKYFLKKSN